MLGISESEAYRWAAAGEFVGAVRVNAIGTKRGSRLSIGDQKVHLGE